MTASRENRKAQWLKEYDVLAKKMLTLNETKQKKLRSELNTLHAQILTYSNHPDYYNDILAGFNHLNVILVKESKKHAESALESTNPLPFTPTLPETQPTEMSQSKSGWTWGGCLPFFACVAEIDDEQEENHKAWRRNGY